MNRVYLKERAKVAFKRNYWLCVLVALILAVITGASLGSSAGSRSIKDGYERGRQESSYRYEARMKESANVLDAAAPIYGDTELGEKVAIATAIGVGVFVVIIIILIAVAIGMAISVFVTNVLEVGARKFFLDNSAEPVKIDALGYGFEGGHYLNVVKVGFMKNLYIFLWSLLFIIPGIIKSYEYYYVSYLLAEDPNLDYKKALEMSKEMTDGHKWDIFVLELSFLGWRILGAITFQMVNIFWTNPYQYATEAELYLYAKDDYREFVEVKKVEEEKPVAKAKPKTAKTTKANTKKKTEK